MQWTDESLWAALTVCEGETFYTCGRGSSPGQPFTYSVHGGEMRVSRKEKAITKSTILLAYQHAEATNGIVPGPKMLKVFGASYIFPVFIRLGIIKRKESMNMPRPKGTKNKPALTIDERIAALEQELTTLRERIQEKENELKTLQDMKNEEQVRSLIDAIAESGKSIQDVIAMVKGTERTQSE